MSAPPLKTKTVPDGGKGSFAAQGRLVILCLRTVLTLSLGSDQGLEPFSVDGIIVSVRSARSLRPRYGVQFLEMTPSAMTGLGDYLLKLLGPDA